MMTRRAAYLALLAMAFLTLQGAECVAPEAGGQHSMACCRSMKCLPSQHSHQCCKASAPSHHQTALPQRYSTWRAPAPAVVAYVTWPRLFAKAEASIWRLARTQHPPPELYTRYSSLLI